jgi:hypothetical protein
MNRPEDRGQKTEVGGVTAGNFLTEGNEVNEGEKFLEDLSQVLGNVEMNRWGAFWRNRYRENPKAAEQALRSLKHRVEVLDCIGTSRQIINRGAWLLNTYNVLAHSMGGDRP